MSRATLPMRNLAKRLVAYEAVAGRSSATKTPAVFRVCEKLRLHLATFMGNNGFHTLLARALALSNAEVPWLRGMQVNADGTLAGLEELYAQITPDEVFEGGVVLLSQLLGLLVTFIGEDLTVRLVREVWPKVPLKDLDFGEGAKNEKTN